LCVFKRRPGAAFHRDALFNPIVKRLADEAGIVCLKHMNWTES
jgi:hypothetical protein